MTKLKSILKERKMTQTQLFNLISQQCVTPVPKYQISRICNGVTSNFTIITLMKICRALEVTPNDLLRKLDYMHLFKSVE